MSCDIHQRKSTVITTVRPPSCDISGGCQGDVEGTSGRTDGRTWHHFVRFHQAEDYLRLGWLAEPSLAGVHHGDWAVHMRWLCGCKPVQLLGARV